MASLFKVKALYEFEAKEEDDLGFQPGQVIDITEEIDDNWLEGRYTDSNGAAQNGIFPREFVEKYEPPVPSRPTRPTRPKQETAPAPVAEPEAETSIPPTVAEEPRAEPEPPALPAQSKPQPPPVETSVANSRDQDVRTPQSAASATRSPPVRSEPPPAPKPAASEPAEPASNKKPPPIAPKSNAFKDRIAAFNQPAAAPLAPMVPGGSKPSTFIKKPFVAPPPMANSYVPPPKVEHPVHKPYIREEDPEIRQRQEDDRAAAEAAGLTNDQSRDQGDDEDAPQPTSLKERIARLQQQQLEQAQRRADGGQKKEKKPPVKKPSEHEADIEAEGEGEEVVRQSSMDTGTDRKSLDALRERPPVPPAQRQTREPMSPLPVAPESELVSDGHEADQSGAGDTTEDETGTIGPEDSDEKHAPIPPPRAATAPTREPDVGEEEGATEEGEEDDDSMDEETRRRLAIRERMAKMSGGMGMAGMFGGGMPMPGMPGGAPQKKRSTKEKRPSEDDAPPSSPPQPAQRVPMVPVPGMSRVQSPQSDRTQTSEDQDDGAAPRRSSIAPSRKSTTEERGAAPPVPGASRPSMDRAAPPVPESRPVPPPPPAAPLSPGPGSESDDEASIRAPNRTMDTSDVETPIQYPIRSVSGAALPSSGSIQSPDNKRTSYFGGSEPMSAVSDKRASRPPPPVPGSPISSPRPPPPLPPGAVPSRRPTQLESETERGESEYEGDYDTDIASGAKHKDALKAHAREPSLDDSTTADETPMSPPPLPPHATRAVPPPPPSRPSMDAPRAPPPVPPSRPGPDDDDYDPYRYDGNKDRGPPPPMPSTVPVVAPPIPPSREHEAPQESSADDLYSSTPPRRSVEQPPRAVPAPPQQEAPPARAPPRQSLDVQRSNTIARRSMDGPRPGENGQIANDLDLAENTTWWTDSQPLPPVLQSRNGIDILSECEESTTSKRGGRTTISKDIYVLFIDYSQTIITVQYDSQDPADAKLEQRHISPAPKLRQDQLETYWQRFGSNIAKQANELGHAKKDSVVGDGSPGGLVSTLIKSQKDALQPIGSRAFGSLVYANLANASTLQHDEIRPGDIVTLRNTRFEGSHGAMKHKYKQEYGTMHVAIVEEWDGTRKSIRAWEQGREKAKVRSEKFRLGDLRSGEVKVWRVVGRDWVEWQ